MTKILIGTPIYDKKMYSWFEYVKAIKSLKVPNKDTIAHVLVIDTSDEVDSVKFKVQDQNFMYQHLQIGKPMDRVVAARNAIFDYAHQNDYDYVLFIDSDVIVPANTITQLWEYQMPVVSGFYPILTEFGLPTPCAKMLNKEAPGFIDFPPDKLDGRVHSVDLVGLGCILISFEIFSKFKFRCERGKYGDLIKSEDWCFCEDLKKSGVAINFDTDLSAKHKLIGEHWDPKEA